MKNILLAVLMTLTASFGIAQSTSEPFSLSQSKTNKIEFRATLVAMGVASLMDVHSSRILWKANTEARPWDRSKYTAISVGVLAVAEVLIVHKWPKAHRVFKFVNGGIAASEATIAIRNYNTDPVIRYEVPTGVVRNTRTTNPSVGGR